MKTGSHLVRLRRFVAGLGLIGAVGLLAAPATAQQQQQVDGWGERAPLLLPRSEMSIAELNGRIYALGGYPGARVTSDAVQVYDSATDTWGSGPSLPRPLHHTMAAAADGRLYLIGGEAGNPTAGESVFQDRVYMLDEAAGAWIERAPMPTARSGGAAGVIDGKIYVAGGRPPRGHDLAGYDPREDRWTVLPDLPTQRNHLSVSAIDGRLYVAGGRFGGGVGSEMTAVLEIFEPATNEWRTGASLPAPRAGTTSVAANGCLHVIGGEGNTSDPRGVFDLHEAYDPATNTWSSLPALPLAVHGLTGAAFLDGWIHVPGGATRAGVSGPNVTFAHQVYRTTLTCGPAA